jgi:hypothetical protein
MRTRRLRLRLWKYEAVWDRLVSDGEGSLHPSRGVRSLINVQPGETASAKEQRTQRRFILLMTERESKKFWNWRKFRWRGE